MSFRAGFVALVGRTNVGKSTLANALAGTKVSIVSDHPQTTRRAVRAVVDRPDGQLVLVDTPGLHRPRTPLGERLNEAARAELAGVDAVAFCVPADQRTGPGDRFIAAELARSVRVPVLAVVTKADRVAAARLAPVLVEVAALAPTVGLGEFAEVVPVSAVSGWQLDRLVELLVARLPAGPALYPERTGTDAATEERVAELVREAALAGVRDELPHSIAVVVEEMGRRPDRDLVDVHASLFVERPSQKAIVLGAGGSRLRDVGTAARRGIEELLGAPVFLDLRVKVARDWQRDPRQLRRLGL